MKLHCNKKVAAQSEYKSPERGRKPKGTGREKREGKRRTKMVHLRQWELVKDEKRTK
jgi:hypothetical protein